MKVAYFVQDLNDPAVARRVRMLQTTNAQITLLGFSRGTPPATIGGLTPLCLGRTEDGRLKQRIVAVLLAALRSRLWRSAVAGADVIIARQLETLALASRTRDAVAPSARMIYECLDIHRLMVDPGPKGRLLRALEAYLLRRCQALIVSSPEFIRFHFARHYPRLPPVHLIENKVLASEFTGPVIAARPVGPLWRIGWFGVIRCGRSLDLLATLARSGAAEIVIRGRVARDAIPDFDTIVAATPNLSYLGPYDRGRDLQRIYNEVHFAWSIDYSEAGANSDWLLPNRIYEGGLFGAVPIARDGCATAAWLRQHQIGVTLEGDAQQALDAFFKRLDQAGYRRLASSVSAAPVSAFLYDDHDCAAVMAAVLAS